MRTVVKTRHILRNLIVRTRPIRFHRRRRIVSIVFPVNGAEATVEKQADCGQ